MFSLKNKVLFRGSDQHDFFQYVSDLKERIRNRMESDEAFLALAQRAITGEVIAVTTSSKEIERHIRDKPYTGSIPEAFKTMDLTSAIFQEWIGFSVAAPWLLDRQYAFSSKMQIIGDRISIAHRGEYQPYSHPFHSVDRVEQLQRSLIRHDPLVRLDQTNPSAEFKIDDFLWPGRFIRVAMWAPPRVWKKHPVITFRRQIVEHMSLEDQAGSGLIPAESVDLFANLVQTYPNMIVSGPVESGKSTFANTLVAEQLLHADYALGVSLIENHPESTLPYAKVSKRHRVIPLQAKASELMEVGIESLRHDPDIIFMTEMRWGEWLFYNFAGEKGYRGLIGTFHTKDAEDIPYQGAFAVYSESGGNLKGHLMGTLKSVELVAVLEPMRFGKKKLMRLSEICYDPDHSTAQVFARDLMRYDDQTDSWTYSSDISASLWARMLRSNRTCAEHFKKRLHELSQQHPMHDPVVPSRKCQVVLEGND